MTTVEIEPLLNQIDTLAAHFGRVQADLRAIAARGRAEDYRGVMQNTRLVLEAILRDLVTRELKQSVGKAMLDELITKFRQQANAGIIPTNILAHMGTVQAWGNLSAHDHAGSLTDEGVKVGKQEVVASLNSMVAILNWYAGKLGATPPIGAPAAAAATQPMTAPPAAAVAAKKKSPVPIIGGVVALLGCLAAGYWWTSRVPAVTTPPADAFAELDADYKKRGEPLPPAGCRRADEAAALAKASDAAALSALHGAEADYFLARVKHEAGEAPGPELQRATACSGFAAALSLQGKAEVRAAEAASKGGDPDGAAERYGKAARAFDAALAAAPAFNNARFNRGLVLMKLGKTDDALKDFNEVIAADAKFGEAHFFVGYLAEKAGDAAKARASYCAAFKNGVTMAKDRCGEGQ